MTSSSDSKTNTGLANSLSNVFKLADVNGLKWIRYLGPNSTTLEAPKDDPVLNSYARLLSEGYACSWRRLSPCTDGMSGEGKDLWLFFFIDHLPDIIEKLADGLTEKERGSWEDGMTTESSTMLYRSLHNIIERSLMSEHYLPLGKWFAKPDSSVATDGSTRGCFLCSFSFFVHAHLYICASVDMRAGPHLQPLLPTHINQALESSTGLQVILSPSGLNAVMTGHSYKVSDAGIDEILEEWKLFYPRRFALDPSPNLPAAIEVLLGGVRVRYPSQFVFVYHGDENAPSPPNCVLNDQNLDETIHETWDTARCINIVSQQKTASQCRCQDPASSRGSHRRLSGHLELPLKSGTLRHGSNRYHPYLNAGSSMAKKAKELATPGSLNLTVVPHLNVKRKLSRFGMPKYTTPLSSPAMPLAPLSPTSHVKIGGTPGPGIAGESGPIPMISVSSGAPPTPTIRSYSTCEKYYDQSRLPPGAVTSVTLSNPPLSPNVISLGPHQQLLSPGVPAVSRSSWWDSLDLPESGESMASLLSYDLRQLSSRRNGLGNLTPSTPTLTALLSPSSKKIGSPSPSRRGRNSIDHFSQKPNGSPINTNPGLILAASERPNTPSSATKLHPVSSGTRDRILRDADVREIGGVGPILAMEDSYDGVGVDSPISHNGESHQTSAEMLLDGGFGSEKSKPQIDVFSDKAVKIDESGLDQIFASDEEDESQEGMEMSQFTYGDGRAGGLEQVDMSINHKVSKAETMSIPELSRIYPTPPSVEMELDKFDEIKEERMEGTSIVLSTPAPQWDTDLLDDDCVPAEFAPLHDVMNFTQTLPRQCIYIHRSSASSGVSNKITSGNDIDTSRTTNSVHSEPQKFIFPPPTSLASRIPIRENLTLSLTKQTRFSPSLFTSHPSATVTSSPAHTLSRSGGSGPGVSWFPRHLTTPSLLTPLDSPFETVTPTPLSATTNNRLMPVLPEAHGLYINLALLDSAIGTNLSETLPISAGPLMNSLSRFIQLNSKRMKLDSIAESTSALDTDVSGSTDLLSCQDEKPLMTFGIADYPSLGFEEELGVGGMSGMPDVGSSSSPLGALSKFISRLTGEPSTSTTETVMANFPLMKFLELLQDYCLHLCFSGCQDSKATFHGIISQKEGSHHTHLMLRTPSNLEENHDITSCKLYHSHSVVSAVLNAKQLIVSAGKKSAGGALPPSKLTGVALNKEDNSGAWILDLLTLPTKFLTKRLKELRSVFQSSFNQTPCLKFSTKGPLTLKDLQQLKPSHTAISDECLPLPITPVLVGHDHEWLSVSPLSLPAWDKLLFEPYALRKNVAYLVLVPSPGLSSCASTISKALTNYFRDLSITFKNCQLGQHVPLEKDIGADGILLISGDHSTSASDTDDANTSTRHGAPVGVTELNKFCKKVLSTYLSSLPSDNEELLSTYTPSFLMSNDPANIHHTTHHSSSYQSSSSSNNFSVNHATHPLTIVLYVLCDSLLISSSNKNEQSQEERLWSFHILHTLSEMLMDEGIPDFIRSKLLLQLVDPKELLGPSSGRCGQLRSLAFSVYSRCRPAFSHLDRARTLTSFGPTAERESKKGCFYRQVYAPPFILSPEPPLSGSGPILGTQIHPILFDPDEAVLFCGYCVSSDQRWMLVVCCDRQGELLDTSVIGIPHSTSYDVDESRGVALQKLWMYLTSVVSGSVFRWSLVITRFGKPGNSEIRDWPGLIPDDGLLTANQVLCGDCGACTHTSCHPHFSNVIVVSVQPERNIQLFPTGDPNPAVSHVMVLPLDPRAAAAVACTTPSATDAQNVDVMELFGSGDPLTDGLGMDGIAGLDLGSELSGINISEEFKNSIGFTTAVEDTTPKATGYLISTLPPGDLPKEFWGHERPQTCCSMFKVLLHCHRSEKLADSPQETLASTLLCFDALSWLTMDHITRQRRTCLPVHLYVLAKLYKMFSLLNYSER